MNVVGNVFYRVCNFRNLVQNFRHHTSCRQEHRYFIIIIRSAYNLCLTSYAIFIYTVSLITRDCRASGTTGLGAPKKPSALRGGVERLKKKKFPAFLDFVIYRFSALHITHTYIPSMHVISLVLLSTVRAGLCCCIYKSAIFCPSKLVASHVLQYTHVIIILHRICCI